MADQSRHLDSILQGRKPCLSLVDQVSQPVRTSFNSSISSCAAPPTSRVPTWCAQLRDGPTCTQRPELGMANAVNAAFLRLRPTLATEVGAYLGRFAPRVGYAGAPRNPHIGRFCVDRCHAKTVNSSSDVLWRGVNSARARLHQSGELCLDAEQSGGRLWRI